MDKSKASAKVRSPKAETDLCVVCFKTAKFYSVGICDHPVCYECSTRMRVLIKQKECPICRKEMDQVSYLNIVRYYTETNF